MPLAFHELDMDCDGDCVFLKQMSFFIVVEVGDDCLRSCTVGRERPDMQQVLGACVDD